MNNAALASSEVKRNLIIQCRVPEKPAGVCVRVRERERGRERGGGWEGEGGNNVISQRKAAGKRRDTTAWS